MTQGPSNCFVASLQLVDLGEPAASEGSVGGCLPQEEACLGAIPGCGRRGRCVGGLEQPECECEPGWSGLGCKTPTDPVALGRASFVKVALSFTPAPHVLTLQLRLRSRGARDGLLVLVNTHHEDVGLALHVSIPPPSGALPLGPKGTGGGPKGVGGPRGPLSRFLSFLSFPFLTLQFGSPRRPSVSASSPSAAWEQVTWRTCNYQRRQTYIYIFFLFSP